MEGVIERTVLEACRGSARIAAYRQIRLSTFGRLRAVGYDLAVDFMDMTDDRRLLSRCSDARPGFEVAVGRYVVVGDEDADPQVARITAIDADGNIELEVLRGSGRSPDVADRE